MFYLNMWILHYRQRQSLAPIIFYVFAGIGFMLSLTILVLEKLWATGLAKHHLSSQETNNAVALSSDETLRNIYQSQAPTVTVTQAD